jgi:hypothetical protein
LEGSSAMPASAKTMAPKTPAKMRPAIRAGVVGCWFNRAPDICEIRGYTLHQALMTPDRRHRPSE